MGLLFLGNIIQAIFVVITNSTFNALFGILIAPQFTLAAFGWAVAYYLMAVAIYTFTAGLNSYVGDKLIHYLNLNVTITFLDKWMKSGAYFGRNFLTKKTVINPAGTLSSDIQESNRLTVKLGDNLINTVFAFFAGMYGLWALSYPLTFQIAATVIVIPGYIALGALIYAVFYNLIVNKIGHRLKTVTEKQHNIVNKLEANIHHVEKNAKGIELLRANKKEMSNFTKILNKGGINYASMAKLQAGLAAFTAFNEHSRFFVGILLSIPQILSKKMSVDSLLTVGDYFTKVASLPTWPYDNYEDVTSITVFSGKLIALQAEINEWEQIKSKYNLEFNQGTCLAIEKLFISKPDQSIILETEHFAFRNKIVTLVQGPSGAGKSIVIDAITGLWPFATGKITLPCHISEIHVIPQKPVFPMRGNLYQAILYTHDEGTSVISNQHKEKMDALLVEFKLDNSVLLNKNEKRDWSKTLSGGEQQRIALIRAILADPQPKLLLMDEPFSALDHDSRIHCEQVLKKYLPNTTIIFIDHRSNDEQNKEESANEQDPFFDERVVLKNKTLCRP